MPVGVMTVKTCLKPPTTQLLVFFCNKKHIFFVWHQILLISKTRLKPLIPGSCWYLSPLVKARVCIQCIYIYTYDICMYIHRCENLEYVSDMTPNV